MIFFSASEFLFASSNVLRHLFPTYGKTRHTVTERESLQLAEKLEVYLMSLLGKERKELIKSLWPF